MAKVVGVPGEWARVRGTVHGLWPLFLAFTGVGFSLAWIFLSSVFIGALLLLASLAFGAWCLRLGLLRVEHFYKGARGEERVASILRSLPDNYHIFNDFRACGVHVDHVVVGPVGVFAVETKFWRGRVSVEENHVLLNGQMPDREPLAQVRREASLVKAQLMKAGWKGDVTPVLTFASDNFNREPAEVMGAVVINSCEIKSCFVSGQPVLTAEELDRLVSLMENNS